MRSPDLFIASVVPTLATYENYFGLDTLIIFLLLLFFNGAKRLPEITKRLGDAPREVSKARHRSKPFPFSEKVEVCALILLLLGGLMWAALLAQRL